MISKFLRGTRPVLLSRATLLRNSSTATRETPPPPPTPRQAQGHGKSSSSSSSSSSYLPAIGGVTSVCAVATLYKLKKDRDDALRRKDTTWDYDGGDGTASSKGGILRQTKENASAIRVLGRVLYSVVQQEFHGNAQQADRQEDDYDRGHGSSAPGGGDDTPLSTLHTKRDLEGNITYLLQQLSYNPSLHDAIASQALPLLLRVATTPMASSLVISHKQMSAMAVLNDLATTSRIGKKIISMAHDERLLVPLLKNLSRIERWRVKRHKSRESRSHTDSIKNKVVQANERKEATGDLLSGDLLFAGLFKSLENHMQTGRHDTLVMPTACTLSTVPFVPPPDFGLRARSQGEVEVLLNIAEGMLICPDDVMPHNVQTLRQFALRMIEATVHANEEASPFFLLPTTSKNQVRYDVRRTLSGTRRQPGTSRPVSVDWDRILANVPGGDPSDTIVLLSLMRADAAANESAQLFNSGTTLKDQQDKKTLVPLEAHTEEKLSLGQTMPWNGDKTLAHTLVSNWITRRGREVALSEAPVTSVSSSAIQLLALQVLALLTACGSDEAQHIVPLLEELHDFGLAQRSRLAQLSLLPPDADPTSRQRVALEKFVLEQSEWLLSNIISNCATSLATFDILSASSLPDSENTLSCTRNWLELTLSWLQVEDFRVRKHARDVLFGHVVVAQRPNRSEVLMEWLSTILDSMSLLLPVITGQRTKVELQVGQTTASSAKKAVTTDSSAVGEDKSLAATTMVQSSQAISPDGAAPINESHRRSVSHSPSESLTHWLSHASKAFAIAFDAAEDFGGKWERDSSAALAMRENNLELLESAKVSGVLEALRAAVDESGGLENCNVHVAKNVARAVANITSCDLALALARRELDAETGASEDLSDLAAFDGTTSIPVFDHNFESQFSSWLPLLSSWAAETDDKRDVNDLKLIHHAKRALAHLQGYRSLACPIVEDERRLSRASRSRDCANNSHSVRVYADGCFPVHMPYGAFDSSDDKSATTADIVFLHGLGGGAFETWHQDMLNDNFDVSQFWPALWVPSDFERRTGGMQARVISMAYEATPLLVGAQTSHLLLPLADTASQIRKKLELAGVGRQGGPVVFVTHSLGGLVTKEMLLQAARDVDPGVTSCSTKNMRAIADETRAIVFYSVPHKGSPMMDFLQSYKDGLVGVGLARDHPVLPFLNTAYGPGLKLNEEFGRMFGDRCLSIGEGAPETLVGLLDMDIAGRELLELFNLESKGMIQVVERDSSNPGFGSYELIPGIPHSMINKPANMGTDRRYLSMMEFVAGRCMVEQQQRKQEGGQ